jgi:membrane-associated phospholipid phosphatase
VWYLEVPLLVVGYLAFGLARGRIGRGEQLAMSNALILQDLERSLHLAIERPLNAALLGHPFAIYLIGYFYRLCVVAVPAVLIWLYVSSPGHYRYLRTVLVVTTLLDLPFVWLFPMSPPRFAQDGIVDYVGTYDILGGGSLRNPQSGLNLFAAMPSMHIAWTSWCAYAAWSVLRRRNSRAAWLAWLYPAVTAVVVLVTGNHYVLDVLGGVAVLALAIGLTRWMVSRGWEFAGGTQE